MTSLRRVPLGLIEDVDSALAAVDRVHACADSALIHQRLPLFKSTTLKLVDECQYQLFRLVAEEWHPEP